MIAWLICLLRGHEWYYDGPVRICGRCYVRQELTTDQERQ